VTKLAITPHHSKGNWVDHETKWTAQHNTTQHTVRRTRFYYCVLIHCGSMATINGGHKQPSFINTVVIRLMKDQSCHPIHIKTWPHTVLACPALQFLSIC